MKVFFAIALLAIIGALGAAGLAMLRSGQPDTPGTNRRMMRALALRVGLSILLFLIILVSFAMGWIRPTGIPVAG